SSMPPRKGAETVRPRRTTGETGRPSARPAGHGPGTPRRGATRPGRPGNGLLDSDRQGRWTRPAGRDPPPSGRTVTPGKLSLKYHSRRSESKYLLFKMNSFVPPHD